MKSFGMMMVFAVAVGGSIAVLTTDCVKPQPTPVNPSPDATDAAPPVPCSTACAHVAALPHCLTVVSCLSICDRVVINQPEWPGRVNAATSCDDLKPGMTSGATHGPGSGRSGP